MSKKKEGSSFGRWYSSNKDALNARRRTKYHSDPAYREKVKEQVNNGRKRVVPESAPESHPHTFEEAAALLGVSQYSLRDWRRRGYFPEPFRKNQRFYFSNEQLSLLGKLQVFLKDAGARRPDDLETMKNLMHLNWGEN